VALTVNITTSWKSLPGANTLAYLPHLYVLKKKVCVSAIDYGLYTQKKFFFTTYQWGKPSKVFAVIVALS
jgi:hypothetical protein